MKDGFWRQYFGFMPRGLYGLLLLQLLSMGLYSVVFANYAYYLQTYFDFSSLMIKGYFISYISFLFILHALAGFMGGRLLSFRSIIAVSFSCTFIGSLLLVWQTLHCFYWGASFSLLGAGLSTAAINCLITQLFKPEDKRRESAFLWVFALMNIGFLASYFLQISVTTAENYTLFYLSVALLSLLALFIVAFCWHNLYDRTTYILSVIKRKTWILNVYGGVLLFAALLLTYYCLIHTHYSDHLLAIVCGVIMLVLLVVAIRQPSQQTRNKIFAFFIFLIVSIIFWSMTLLIPSEMGFFLDHTYQRTAIGLSVYTHWYQAIIGTTTIIIAPLLGALLFKLRHKGVKIAIPMQFAFGLLFIGLAFIILPLSIHHIAHLNFVHGAWLVFAYVLVGIGQLFVQPVGLAMIGQLAPMALQSILMGCWMMVLGIAAFIAKHIADYLQAVNSMLTSHAAANHYAHFFVLLGWCAISVALFVLLLLPLLNQLTRYRSLNPALNKK